MRLKRWLKEVVYLSGSSVSVMLLTCILGGCSSDFSRFTDGISKSSAPQTQLHNRPVEAYPPAPGGDIAHEKVESSALAPPPAALAAAKTSGADGAQTNTYLQAPPPALSERRASANAGADDKRKKITYIVVAGDSLSAIGLRHKISVASIKRENELKGDKILIGQKLTLVDAALPAESAPAAPAEPKEIAPLKTAEAVPLPAAEPNDGGKSASGAANAGYDADKTKTDAPEMKAGAADNSGGANAEPAASKQNTPEKAGAAAAWSAPNAGGEKKDVAHESRGAESGAAEIAGAKAAAKPVESSTENAKSAESGAPMIWPLKGNIISSYGQRTGTTSNDGIDIAVAEDTPVKAAEAGTVIYAGDGLKEFGNTILIRHENNIVTVYGHNSKLLVSRGQQVKQGDVIAQSGSSGNASVAKLHFEVRQNSAPVNPMKYLPSAH